MATWLLVERSAGSGQPHIMCPMETVHQRQQKAQRRGQAALERRGFAVGQGVLLRGGGRRSVRALDADAP